MTIFYPKLSASKGLIPVGGDLWARQPPQVASMKGTNIIGILDLSPKLLKVSGQEILTSRKYCLILWEENPRNKKMSDLLSFMKRPQKRQG